MTIKLRMLSPNSTTLTELEITTDTWESLCSTGVTVYFEPGKDANRMIATCITKPSHITFISFTGPIEIPEDSTVYLLTTTEPVIEGRLVSPSQP